MFPRSSEHDGASTVGPDVPYACGPGGLPPVLYSNNPSGHDTQPIVIPDHAPRQIQANLLPSQESRLDAHVSTQQPQMQPIQTVDLMAHETNTHMISTLNWISPTMDFDLTDFDYDQMVPSEQYWGPPADVNDLLDQPPPTSHIQNGPVGHQTYSTPDTLQDSDGADMPGKAYVDNKGARQPRNGRYSNRVFGEAVLSASPNSCPTLPAVTPEPDGFSLVLPSFAGLLEQEVSETRVHPFSPEQYRNMCQAFQDYCLLPSGALHGGMFFSTELPSTKTFTTLMALYRERFDPRVLPMIHPELDSEETSSWVVKLAMSAIGSQYLETGNMELAAALHEFLRRVLRQRAAVFSNEILTMESLASVQSKVLNYVGLAYCGLRRLERYKTSALEDLIGEYVSIYKTQSAILQDETVVRCRRDWILAQSARRLCHAIWLMETMSRYHFNTQPRLLLDFATIVLPCGEDAWQASTEQMRPPAKQPTLEKALWVLYVEKRLLEDIGDFARVLIIHGLYCQTWDIARSLSRPLLRWSPSAKKGNAESHEVNTGPPWLPQIPLYNNWRNAACDCLDVLHWIANSDIARSGTENPTVLHLHFARVVLLAPSETIRDMAELLVSEDVRHGNAAEKFREQRRQVRAWIMDDQFKARLALVHCGVLFWHVRRYSTDAFNEPIMVFLATLVVWAYGSLCPPQQQVNGSSQASTDSRPRDDDDWSSDVQDISSIRLDRPTDDELVQIFIKRGRSMNATIMGVGGITAPNGPRRMLREGCRILNTLDKWPIRNQHLHVLARLIDVCGQEKQWLQTVSSARPVCEPT